MKKPPPTPDTNAKAPRPESVSTDDPDIPTMDVPPQAPSDTATAFDRGTAAADQEYRAGLLPGSDTTTLREEVMEQLEIPDRDSEKFPQQDDPDQESMYDEQSGRANTGHPANPNHEEVTDSEDEDMPGAAKRPAQDADRGPA